MMALEDVGVLVRVLKGTCVRADGQFDLIQWPVAMRLYALAAFLKLLPPLSVHQPLIRFNERICDIAHGHV